MRSCSGLPISSAITRAYACTHVSSTGMRSLSFCTTYSLSISCRPVRRRDVPGKQRCAFDKHSGTRHSTRSRGPLGGTDIDRACEQVRRFCAMLHWRPGNFLLLHLANLTDHFISTGRWGSSSLRISSHSGPPFTLRWRFSRTAKVRNVDLSATGPHAAAVHGTPSVHFNATVVQCRILSGHLRVQILMS